MPSKQKSEHRLSGSEVVFLRTLDDGTALMVERAMSSTSEAHRFTVLINRGRESDETLAFLDTLCRTFSGTLGPLTCYEPELTLGKLRTCWE